LVAERLAPAIFLGWLSFLGSLLWGVKSRNLYLAPCPIWGTRKTSRRRIGTKCLEAMRERFGPIITAMLVHCCNISEKSKKSWVENTEKGKVVSNYVKVLHCNGS